MGDQDMHELVLGEGEVGGSSGVAHDDGAGPGQEPKAH